jgi:hypothetical protein
LDWRSFFDNRVASANPQWSENLARTRKDRRLNLQLLIQPFQNNGREFVVEGVLLCGIIPAR